MLTMLPQEGKPTKFIVCHGQLCGNRRLYVWSM